MTQYSTPDNTPVERILRNKIRCLRCNTEIESKHRHDFKYCPCGAAAVDGGLDYLKRCGNMEDIVELSEFTTEPEPPRRKRTEAETEQLLLALFGKSK